MKEDRECKRSLVVVSNEIYFTNNPHQAKGDNGGVICNKITPQDGQEQTPQNMIPLHQVLMQRLLQSTLSSIHTQRAWSAVKGANNNGSDISLQRHSVPDKLQTSDVPPIHGCHHNLTV